MKDFSIRLIKDKIVYLSLVEGTPKIHQLRVGPLWMTLSGRMVTIWWGSHLRIFHGSFLVRDP